MSSDEEELNAVVPVATDPPDEHQDDCGHYELATINDGTMLDQLKRDEPHEGHSSESSHKRGRWEACVMREQNLIGAWEAIESNMENPWKDLDWSQKKPEKPGKGKVRIVKNSECTWDWQDSRPCDKLLLAHVRQARMQEESQAIQLQGISKLSQF